MSTSGRYLGTPKVEFLPDGRVIRLLEPLVYIDPTEERWTAPKNAQADGASIPRLLWPLIGSPLTGRYRDASIIHDFYCSKRHKPWQAVHRVFFEAMITSGVSVGLAKVMYAGVRLGGPKWTSMDSANAVVPYAIGKPLILSASWEKPSETPQFLKKANVRVSACDAAEEVPQAALKGAITATEIKESDVPYQLKQSDVSELVSRYLNEEAPDLSRIDEELASPAFHYSALGGQGSGDFWRR